MYFQQLEALKDFENISKTDVILFDAILFSVYKKGLHRRFNPRVYNQFDIQLDEQKWLKALDGLVELGCLYKSFELCSPYSNETIEIYKRIDEIPLGSCKYSSEDNADFEITESDIFITYSFNDLFNPLDSDSSDDGGGDSFNAKKSRSQNQASLNPSSLSPLCSASTNLSLATLMNFYPQNVIDQYLEDNRKTLIQMLDDVVLADSSTSKGNTLEDLVKHLFSFPYLKFHGNKIKNNTGEIDVAFRVKRTPATIFENFSDLLIVESKNWKDKAGASEIKVFADKMNEAQSKVGVFFSKEGVTGRANHKRDAKGVIRDKWKVEKLIIIVIDLNDLNRIIKEKHSLYVSLEEKYYDTRLL